MDVSVVKTGHQKYRCKFRPFYIGHNNLLCWPSQKVRSNDGERCRGRNEERFDFRQKLLIQSTNLGRRVQWKIGGLDLEKDAVA